jgi:hypothetical protein
VKRARGSLFTRWLPPLTAFIIFVMLVLRVLSAHNWDPLALVLLTPDNLPSDQTFGVGYDGRFVYHIAVNEFGDVAGLDEPNYRYQRIVMPLIVKALSLGRANWAPWIMIAINVIALTACTALLGKLLRRRGRSEWLAFAFSFSIGALLALRLDLLEPLALGLALAGLLAYETKRPGLAVVLFAASGLTKEVGLVFPLALALYELRGQRWKRAGALLLPALLFAGYYLVLAQTFGVPEDAVEKTQLLWLPFSGLSLIEDGPSRVIVLIWAIGPAALALVAAAVDIIRTRGQGLLAQDAMILFANAALVATLPAPTWVDPLAILRLALGLIIALLLWAARGHKRWLPAAFGLWIVSGLIVLPIPGMF